MSTTADLAARFRLVELQREELKIQTKVDDYAQWGGPALDPAGYQKKEALQRATAHSARGSVFWALVERLPVHAGGTFASDSDVHDDGIVPGETPIVCHCESHMFDCALRQLDGTIVRGFSHHIGSVFTLPAFRGRGLARFFLTHVAQRMRKLPRAVASVLYSDIGPTFYDRLGWRLHASDMVTLDVAAQRNASIVVEDNASDAIKLFVDDALDAFLATDNARVLAEIASDAFAGKQVYAPLPTRDAIEWQFCLGVHYATVRGFPEKPAQCGLRLRDDAFAVWCHNIKESTLYVVHARFPEADAGATVLLLRAAIAEARKFGLAKVAIWDATAARAVLQPAVAAQLSVVKEEREDSLSSLMVFDDHRDGEGAGVGALPTWLNNEKFAWV